MRSAINRQSFSSPRLVAQFRRDGSDLRSLIGRGALGIPGIPLLAMKMPPSPRCCSWRSLNLADEITSCRWVQGFTLRAQSRGKFARANRSSCALRHLTSRWTFPCTLQFGKLRIPKRASSFQPWKSNVYTKVQFRSEELLGDKW